MPKMKKFHLPSFDCFIDKGPDGTYSAVIGLGNIPDRKLAELSLKHMKKAMDDYMHKLLGKFNMEEIADIVKEIAEEQIKGTAQQEDTKH